MLEGGVRGGGGHDGSGLAALPARRCLCFFSLGGLPETPSHGALGVGGGGRCDARAPLGGHPRHARGGGYPARAPRDGRCRSPPHLLIPLFQWRSRRWPSWAATCAKRATASLFQRVSLGAIACQGGGGAVTVAAAERGAGRTELPPLRRGGAAEMDAAAAEQSGAEESVVIATVKACSRQGSTQPTVRRGRRDLRGTSTPVFGCAPTIFTEAARPYDAVQRSSRVAARPVPRPWLAVQYPADGGAPGVVTSDRHRAEDDESVRVWAYGYANMRKRPI